MRISTRGEKAIFLFLSVITLVIMSMFVLSLVNGNLDLEGLIHVILHVMLFPFLSFISAFVLQFATKSLYQFKPSYQVAFKACFILLIITAAIYPFILGGIEGLRDKEVIGLWVFSSFVIFAVIFAVLLGIMLKHPEFGAIGIRKGFVLGLILMTTLLLLYKIIAPLMISAAEYCGILEKHVKGIRRW